MRKSWTLVSMFGGHSPKEVGIIRPCFEENALEVISGIVAYEQTVEEEVDEDENGEEDHEGVEGGHLPNQPCQPLLPTHHIGTGCVGFIIVIRAGGVAGTPSPWAERGCIPPTVIAVIVLNGGVVAVLIHPVPEPVVLGANGTHTHTHIDNK